MNPMTLLPADSTLVLNGATLTFKTSGATGDQANIGLTLGDTTDEQLEAMVEYLETSLEAQARGSVRVIEGTIEPTAAEATAPSALEPPKPKNRLMLETDTAVGPRERMPRKVRPPPGS